MGILARGGYELTPRADEAEVLVVNTCSFIEAAQKESVDAILEMAEHKKFGAAKKLIVAGCLVERYRAQILDKFPKSTPSWAPAKSSASSKPSKAICACCLPPRPRFSITI